MREIPQIPGDSPLLPVSYFGSKRLAAPVIWRLLGDPARYIEPFCGSCATLLLRPVAPGARPLEIVNDLDCMLVNCLRCVRDISLHAEIRRILDSPPAQLDLSARFNQLRRSRESLRKTMLEFPEYRDQRLAAFWLYCMGNCIGHGWDKRDQKPQMSTRSRLGTMEDAEIRGLLDSLAARLRHVVILCGPWRDCVADAKWLYDPAPCGILLDPPYEDGVCRQPKRRYAEESGGSPAAECREWCAAHGHDSRLRIVLCGYDSEHDSLLPLGWRRVEWRPPQGYSESSGARREVLWASPYCLPLDSAPHMEQCVFGF